MDWIGGAGFQFVAAIFGVIVAALGGYSYYRSRISWSELTFILVGAAAVLAYAIAGAGTFLSAPQFVSDILAGLAGLAFIGLFLYWAYSQADEASD